MRKPLPGLKRAATPQARVNRPKCRLLLSDRRMKNTTRWYAAMASSTPAMKAPGDPARAGHAVDLLRRAEEDGGVQPALHVDVVRDLQHDLRRVASGREAGQNDVPARRFRCAVVAQVAVGAYEAAVHPHPAD